MYESFGVQIEKETGTARFRLFLPDAGLCPTQYSEGGSPHIRAVGVVGSFQNWDFDHPLPMVASQYTDPADGLTKGYLFEGVLSGLSHGFYEYKYLVTFENAERRLVTDPCCKHGGTANQNSGFILGGRHANPSKLNHERRPLRDLVIYELMLDDFTALIDMPHLSPVQKAITRLPELKRLGINAIEFMPWTTGMRSDTPGLDGYSWGYDPIQYFSVAHRYTDDPKNEQCKLTHLRELIRACHEHGIQVILDVVCNHADAADPSRGFPYYWLYQEPADCPYVGTFGQSMFYRDLEYDNQCTLEYIRDSLIYWIDEFGIDGLRFDNTLGLYDPNDPADGLPKLIVELRQHLDRTGQKNFPLILEHAWDYSSIDVVNRLGADSCWLDPFRSVSMDSIQRGWIDPRIMRMLDSGRDFASGCPVTYIENHDHRRFAFCAGGRSHWYKMQPYLIALFTCAGAPLLFNGQEYGADNDMPEDGPGRVVPRPLDWHWLESGEGPAIHDLIRRLISIRHQHPSLRSANFYPSGWDEGWTRPNEHGFGIDCDRQIVAYHRWDDSEKVYVLLNFGDSVQHVTFEVPHKGPWKEQLSRTQITADDGLITVALSSNWGMIFSAKNPG